MDRYFKVIKRQGDIVPLEADMENMDYNSFEEGNDTKGSPLYRIKKNSTKLGVIVVPNQSYLPQVKTILERNRK